MRGRSRYRIAFPVVLVLVGLNRAMPSHAASHAQALYDEALLKETGERDPETALTLYQLVIDRAGNDHRLKAQAQLHMGSCLERLGRPKEAEALYLKIIHDSSTTLAEAAQAAQTNLERVQAELKRAEQQAALEAAAREKGSYILVPEFKPNGLSLLLGPTFIPGDRTPLIRGDVALRWSIFRNWRRAAALEFGAITPGGDQAIATARYDATQPFPTATDEGSLHLSYQIHAALIRDLPHGDQTAFVPEIGAGVAYTKSRIDVITNGTDNMSGLPTQSKAASAAGVWSPYLRAAVRCFADRPVSLLMGGSFTPVPYKQTLDTNIPPHTATFDFPKQLWTAGVQILIRFGRTELVERPKS